MSKSSNIGPYALALQIIRDGGLTDTTKKLLFSNSPEDFKYLCNSVCNKLQSIGTFLHEVSREIEPIKYGVIIEGDSINENDYKSIYDLAWKIIEDGELTQEADEILWLKSEKYRESLSNQLKNIVNSTQNLRSEIKRISYDNDFSQKRDDINENDNNNFVKLAWEINRAGGITDTIQDIIMSKDQTYRKNICEKLYDIGDLSDEISSKVNNSSNSDSHDRCIIGRISTAWSDDIEDA